VTDVALRRRSLPDRVERFLCRSIATMTQLEILLLVDEAPQSASAVARQLALMRPHAEEELRRLVRSGLVAADGDTFGPGIVARNNADVLADLQRLFPRYRLAIVHAIFSTDEAERD
jgi:hypothetical protein